MPQQPEERISNVAAGFIICVSLLIGLLHFLLSFIFLGWLVTIIAAPSLALWFIFHNASPFSFKSTDKKAARRAAIFAFNIFIQILPLGPFGVLVSGGWAASTFINVAMVKFEDWEAQKGREKKGGVIKKDRARFQRQKDRRMARQEQQSALQEQAAA